MMQPLSTLLLGFLLGLTYALEADHMIAVSTMVTRSKNPMKAAFVGMFWGIGHTTTLFLVGLIVLVLHVTIPTSVSTGLEGLVGIMLIILGANTVRNASHAIRKPGSSGREIEQTPEHPHRHRRSFLIGSIHGLAGSGALMILVLSTINSMLQGAIYIILFGIGSIAGMSIMSLLFGVPMSFSKRFIRLNHAVHVFIGTISIGFGGFVFYETLSALHVV